MGHKQVPRIILRGDQEEASLMAREGMRQLDILKNLMSFQNLKQDVRRVRFINGSEIICRSIFGIDDVQIYAPKREAEMEILSKLYVYVTISDYVTIWDLETGEVAEDICDNEGKVCNDAGDPLITFPCHKEDLVKWLEGVNDRPTRQVLKDNPENNRDYLDDNHKDIGNESRVERYNDFDPSKECYFGVLTPCAWSNLVQNLVEDTCGSPRVDCRIRSLVEYDTPQDGYIVNCDPELCDKSFNAETWGTIFHAYGSPFYWRDDTVEYLEPYHPRSKYLYLCPYPSKAYLRPGPAPPKMIEYGILACAAYTEPIKMGSSCATFGCVTEKQDYYNEWPLELFWQAGRTFSFKTDLGDLIVNYTPTRYLVEDYVTLYERLRSGFSFEDNCFNLQLVDGVCTYDQYSEWGSGPPDPGSCIVLERSELDRINSESNRLGISWCGSPNPEKEADWYRVLLRFYVGGFHQHGHSCSTSAGEAGNEFYCKDETIISEALVERFSSVQATIELECPEDYPKENTLVPENPVWGYKYKRPEDYSGLCAFPGRDCGHPESESHCYPFDGTYDIYTLGEAVEELINNHYKDESDDQLLVYLLRAGTTVKQRLEHQAHNPRSTVIRV